MLNSLFTFSALVLLFINVNACSQREHDHNDGNVVSTSSGEAAQLDKSVSSSFKAFTIHYTQCLPVPACDQQHCDFENHGCATVGDQAYCCGHASTTEDKVDSTIETSSATGSEIGIGNENNDSSVASSTGTTEASNGQSITNVPNQLQTASNDDELVALNNEAQVNSIHHHLPFYELRQQLMNLVDDIAEVNSGKTPAKPAFTAVAPKLGSCTCKKDNKGKCIGGNQCCGKCGSSSTSNAPKQDSCTCKKVNGKCTGGKQCCGKCRSKKR